MLTSSLCADPQFTKAVEAKQVAQQEAERARFVVMKADQVSWVSACSLDPCLHPSSCMSADRVASLLADNFCDKHLTAFLCWT